MRPRRLDSLLTPRSVAVVGASADPRKAGHQMLATLSSFSGQLYAINPNGGTILGHPALRSVDELAGAVDLAVLTVPAKAVVGALEECVAASVPAAVVCAGGFAESGPDGAALQREIAAVATAGGIRVLGPNTSGLVNPAADLFASFVPAVRDLRPGRLAIVAQSGGVHHVLAFLAHDRGLGVRVGVGLGNAVDVGFADLLDHLADDPGTGAIALHVEGFADGRRVIDAVARAAVRVPVIALVVGRADVGAFARSHTGALTGDWALSRAALAQAGAVTVQDTEELIDAAAALLTLRLPPNPDPGVAVVTGQAGPGLIATDLLRHAGVRVPPLEVSTLDRLAMLLPGLTYHDNPVDTGRPDAGFGEVLTAVAADQAVDLVLAYALHEPEALDPARVLTERRPDVPVVFATDGPAGRLRPTLEQLAAAGTPVYPNPGSAARATRALAADARAAHGLRQRTPTAPAGPRLAASTADEAQLKQLLASAGVRVPRHRACWTRAEVHAAAAALRPPVVVKILTPPLAHKSEVDGVHVGITGAEQLDAALDALDRLGARSYLVEEQAGAGVELIVGASNHPSFGPTVLVGIGGMVAEAVGDVAVRLAPLSLDEAVQMLAELRGQTLLDGFRGLPPVDRQAVARVIVTLGAIACANPRLAALDVNPLRVTSEGPVALDAYAEFVEDL